MDDRVARIAKVLEDWNPLGNTSIQVPDINGYQTEAMDIISGHECFLSELSIVELVQGVLNEAFMLNLSRDDCRQAAEKIHSIISED